MTPGEQKSNMMQVGGNPGDRKGAAVTGSAKGIAGVRSTLASSLPYRPSRADVAAASMHLAPVVLGLFVCGYLLRGGVLLFGFVNMTLVFLLATILCVGVHLLVTRQIRFQFIWADLGMIAFAVLLLANSGSSAGLEKGLRFVVLVLAPYFLARVILTDFIHVKRFLITIVSVITILAIGAFAFWVLPDPVAKLLPYQLVDWDRRLVYLRVNEVHMGLMLMVGLMIYTGLISGWRRIWMIPGLAMIWVLHYDVLLVGSRAALISILGTTLISSLIAVVTRRLSNLPVLLIVFGTTAFILYTVLASGLAPTTTAIAEPVAANETTAATPAETSDANETTAATPAEPTDANETAAIAPAEPTDANETAATAPAEPTDANETTAAAPAETTGANEAASRIRLPLPGITLPNQDRFETLAVVIGEMEDPEKRRVVNQTMSGRTRFLEEALTKFKDNPLLGAGTASMERYAHNIFLETAAELGLLGLALLSAVIVFVLRGFWKFFIKLDQQDPHFHVITTVFLVVSALFILKQFSTSLPHHKDLVTFAAIALNLPLLLRMPAQEGAGVLRGKVPPKLRFLVPARDSVPVEDAKVFVRTEKLHRRESRASFAPNGDRRGDGNPDPGTPA